MAPAALFAPILDVVGHLGADGRRRRRDRGPPLGRRRHLGPLRVPGPEPARRAGRARRHLPGDRGRSAPVAAAAARRAHPPTGGAPDPPVRPRPRRRRPPASTALLGTIAPHDLVDEILARGQGNPFFTEELVAAHVAGEAIPAVLSDLISADIAGLDDEARQVARCHGRRRAVTTDARPAARDRRPRRRGHRTGASAPRSTRSWSWSTPPPTPTGSVTPSSARSSTPTCSRRSEPASIAGSPTPSNSSPPPSSARADRAGELAFHLDRAGDREGAFVALLAAADAAATIAPAAAFAPSRAGVRAAGTTPVESAGQDDRGRPAVAGRRARHVPPSGNERAVRGRARQPSRSGRLRKGEAFGHERLGRYLWAVGLPRGEPSRVRAGRVRSSATDGDPNAAGVFAGLGQAEAHGRPLRAVRAVVRSASSSSSRTPGRRSRWPGRWPAARSASSAAIVGRPREGGRAVPRGHGGGPDSASTSARGDLLLRRAPRRRPQPGGGERRPRRGRRRAPGRARPQLRWLPRRPGRRRPHPARPLVRGRGDAGPPHDRPDPAGRDLPGRAGGRHARGQAGRHRAGDEAPR